MDNEPVNPWLGEIILDFRRNCSDEELRKGYRDCIKGGSSYYSWEEFVGLYALKVYTQDHPLFLMSRREMPISEHARDVLNYLLVNCLADLMQITVEDMNVLIGDMDDRQQITRFLEENDLHLRSSAFYTYRLSLERIGKERIVFNRTLNEMINKIKGTLLDYNRDRMTLAQFKELIDMFEQAECYARQHDCGVEERENLYHQYAFLMELKSPFFEGYSEHAVRIAERMMYYLQIMQPEYIKRADGYMIFGNIYSIMSDNAKALDKYLSALDTLQKAPDTGERDKWLNRIHSRLGGCYWNMKEHEKAIESYKNALEYSDKLLFSRDSSKEQIFENLAEIYSEMGDQKNADYYRELATDDDSDDDFGDDFDDLF